jgi:hypothetical protein
MKRTLLSLAAASAIVSAATLLPSRADAMGVGSAAAVQMALDDMSALENAAYVCRHRYYSSRRVCWWTPGRRYYRPYRYYRRWRYY